MTILIKNGTVVTATEFMAADVLIDGEKVVGIAAANAHPWEEGAGTVIDATDRYVMPGGVDVHTHMELPFGGTSASDTFESGTRAAAWGGTTTLIDFAVQVHGETVMDGYETWMERAAGNCAIDYGFHMIVGEVTDQALKEMDILMDEGVTSFKLFMAYPGVLYSDDGQIFRAMQKAAENGSTIMMHAENGIVIDVLREQALARGQTDPIHHSITRPPVTEAEATHRAIAYAELAGAPLYVVHMSAKEAVEEVASARGRGANVFGETCPQYLFLGWRNLREPNFEGAKYVCSTPVRNEEEGHQEALWKYLATNDLQIVSTDHCPFCMNDHPLLGTQKRLGLGDFTAIPNGLPGVEDRMRMIYHGAIGEGRLSLNRFVEVTATAPAKMFGLYPQKGTIAIGSDADILIWDPNATHTMSVEHNHMDVDYCCYEGTEVQGQIDKVLSRGRVLISDGEYHGSKGDGKYLKRGLCQYLI
ncbi:MAG: dihydropyrimidinase [Actinomycetota bacterium]|nr:dihydropyrimidinase [Actinomycetota bacterium]MDK1016733.1 dihydropyrimidinase [Actinomycetota bacterium]MDK1026091.1 dihydropyrimidinase [Actinomycetota bacterium]MDK1038447.1 dihydropyrimidinase [Actinomycetota bacterium]MDK1096743.1 dihydropyrimidinase [Actinomycetota bacterium]